MADEHEERSGLAHEDRTLLSCDPLCAKPHASTLESLRRIAARHVQRPGLMRPTAFLHRLAESALLMVGVPDYETYVAHRAKMHPGEPVMTYEEFFRERQASRYGTNGGKISRCC